MKWQKIPPEDYLLEGADPYFQLRMGTPIPNGFASPDLALSRPVVVLPQHGEAARLAAQPGVTVPEFYTDPIKGLENTRWCTALAKECFLNSLKTNDELRSLISRITILPPLVPQVDGPSAEIGEDPEKPFGYPDDATVVIGVIDHGIAFAHERFRLCESKSRIEYMWVQDAPPAPSQHLGLAEAARSDFRFGDPAGSQQTLVAVHPVPYGREIRASNIDHLLSSDSGFADEGAIYRTAAAWLGRRWLRSVSRRVAHGTHVMDLACGYDLTEDERTQRPIVCVQLPEATTADTSGENLDAYALDGIRYILERADEIARRAPVRSHLPVVINFSFGNVAGPHDGTSDLEQAIDEIVREREKIKPFKVVVPSGNSHLGRLHAQITFKSVAPDDPAEIEDYRSDESGSAPYRAALHWRVLPDDRTPSFLEIWLPSGGQPKTKSRIWLDVTTPGGLRSEPLGETTPGAGLQLLSDVGAVLCEARYRFVGAPTNRGMFLVALQPTKSSELTPAGEANAVAPSGTWTISLVNTGLGKEPVEAWIQRDDTPYGFPRRGRQSYFDHACYKRFDHGGRLIEEDDPDCIIKRVGSTNAIATGEKTIVVVGEVLKEGKPARYSARRSGRSISAVSDESIVLSGVLAAGTRSGSLVALNGTSVAAPQVARDEADNLAGQGRAQEPQHGVQGKPQNRVERLRRPRLGR
jgi:hypothetical protein